MCAEKREPRIISCSAVFLFCARFYLWYIMPFFLYSCHDDFLYNPLLSSCQAGVHCLYPAKLIAGFEVFSDAFSLGELGHNEVDLFIGLAVDIDEVLHQGVLDQHQCEGVGLMLFQILLPHTPEAADIAGWLGRECKVGVVIVSAFGVSDFHVCILLMIQ